MKFLGCTKGQFTDKVTGKVLDYASMWCSFPANGVVGEKSDKFKVELSHYDTVSKIKPGTEIVPFFDQYGRVIGFDLSN